MGLLGNLCLGKWNRSARSFQDSAVPRFGFTELKTATQNFTTKIGSGGFGNVYKGILHGTEIAVKRRDSGSHQGLDQFLAEIRVGTGLRHPNVLSLLGYCDERREMMLVYEYIGKGTLESHLHDRSSCSLTFNQRLGIVRQAGRGLHYLHTGTPKGTIHRDVKSSNILLDDNLVAKIADLGLSKTGPDPELGKSYVTTEVKGTFGWMDPEYATTKQLTQGSDVYAYGVLLLEVLSGRKALDTKLTNKEEWNLAHWAKKNLKDVGHLHGIVDPRIAGEISPDSLRKFGELVWECLQDSHTDRPSMEVVLGKLDVILKLQTGDLHNDGGGASTSQAPPRQMSSQTSTTTTPPYEAEMPRLPPERENTRGTAAVSPADTPGIGNRRHAATSSLFQQQQQQQQSGDRTTTASSGRWSPQSPVPALSTPASSSGRWSPQSPVPAPSPPASPGRWSPPHRPVPAYIFTQCAGASIIGP